VGVLAHKLTHGISERWQQEMIWSCEGVRPVLSPGVNCEYTKDSLPSKQLNTQSQTYPFYVVLLQSYSVRTSLLLPITELPILFLYSENPC